jgi:hypothetical protein
MRRRGAKHVRTLLIFFGIVAGQGDGSGDGQILGGIGQRQPAEEAPVG